MLNTDSVRVRAQMEAMLFEPVFAVVFESLGTYGGVAAPVFTQALAEILEHAQ